MKRITLKRIRQCAGALGAFAAFMFLYYWTGLYGADLLTDGGYTLRTLIVLAVGAVSVLWARD